MSTQASLGQKAIESKDYDLAIKHYTAALKESKSPLWLTQRSTAYQRKGSYQLALYDAEDAVLQAISRGRRELIAAAQLRRAIALYCLERYGDARLCFTWVRKLNEKEKTLGIWQNKVVVAFNKLPEEAEGRKVTIEEIPEKVDRTAPAVAEAKATRDAVAAASSSSSMQQGTPVQTLKEKIRHEWYQSSNTVTITVFAKNVPKDEVVVKFDTQSLEVTFPTGSASNYEFSLLPTCSKIDVSQSKYNITPSKIEISLHKAMPGQKWAALEGSASELPLSSASDSLSTPAPPQTEATSKPAATKSPAYPTSSRKGAKNWDAVAKDALIKEKKEASKDKDEKDLATTLDDDDVDDEGDPLQGFFKKLYKDASPDTRRAMMKSYVESNGTALSTDWDDVGKKTVPINPPDGIEAKKWST